MTDVMAPVVIGLLGLVFGSFANVVIWRLPRGESLSVPASHCPGCDTPIAWYDNIPVLSWALLRGKCRSCGNPISVRYPMVELASAALWLLAWALWGVSLRTVFGIVFFYFLLILAAIDLDTRRLPNKLVLPLIGCGSVGMVLAAVTGRPATPLIVFGGVLSNPLLAGLSGAVVSAGFALLLALVWGAVRKQEVFGMGDVKLLVAIGVFLGPFGLLVLFVSSLIGSIAGIAAARKSGEGLRVTIPYGPFLALGAVVVSTFGPAMWAWYMGLVV